MTAREIIAEVCAGTGATVLDVLGKFRGPRLVELRRRSMRAIRAKVGWSYQRIAYFFGLRNFKSARNACLALDRPLDLMPPLLPRRLRSKPAHHVLQDVSRKRSDVKHPQVLLQCSQESTKERPRCQPIEPRNRPVEPRVIAS